MKKILIWLLLFLIIPTSCFAGMYDARDLHRQGSSGWINSGVSNSVVKSSAGKIFTVTVTATTAGGYVEIFDAASGNPNVTDDMLVELYEGTVSNSNFAAYNPYLQATKGIMVTTVNAEVIITYY